MRSLATNSSILDFAPCPGSHSGPVAGQIIVLSHSLPLMMRTMFYEAILVLILNEVNFFQNFLMKNLRL
jgi:hypothetical protein